MNYPEDAELQDVYFVTADVGWVAGYARSQAGEGGFILHTRDAGQTWTLQAGDPHSATRGFMYMYFIDETHGWVSSFAGHLMRTTDGETWETMGAFPTLAPYLFTSETTGFYVVGAEIYQTLDAGRTWKHIFTCQTRVEVEGLTQQVGCHLESLHFPSPTVGYAVSRDIAPNAFALAKTEDGGNSWTVSVVRDISGVAGVFFTDENTGFTYRQGLHRTADGGQTWTGVLGDLLWGTMKFADPEVGWICQGNPTSSTLTYTTNGGKRWNSVQFRLPAGVNAFSLPRRDRAYVVGDHGMIYRYSVVPANYTAARAIDAPAMPAVDPALDNQVGQLDAQVKALEQEVQTAQTAENPPAAGENKPAADQAGSESQQGWVEQKFSDQVQQIQASVDGVAAEVPKFTGKYRNLNLIFTGIQLIGQLFGQTQSLKDSLAGLRKARDPQAVTAALSQLTSQVTGLVQNTKTAFQKPQ